MGWIQKMKTNKVKFLAVILLLVSAVFGGGVSFFYNKEEDVKGASDDVTVRAVVPMVEFQFKVYPEKRIPSIGNWDTFADVQLRDCSTDAVLYSYLDIPTDPQGIGKIDILGDLVDVDYYRPAIRGASHLNKTFDCYKLDKVVNYIDLTKENEELLAGEVSNKYDNYINSLDLSVLILDLFSNDYYTDLNQDSLVNSLDLSIQIYNLFKFGDL